MCHSTNMCSILVKGSANQLSFQMTQTKQIYQSFICAAMVHFGFSEALLAMQ